MLYPAIAATAVMLLASAIGVISLEVQPVFPVRARLLSAALEL